MNSCSCSPECTNSTITHQTLADLTDIQYLNRNSLRASRSRLHPMLTYFQQTHKFPSRQSETTFNFQTSNWFLSNGGLRPHPSISQILPTLPSWPIQPSLPVSVVQYSVPFLYHYICRAFRSHNSNHSLIFWITVFTQMGQWLQQTPPVRLPFLTIKTSTTRIGHSNLRTFQPWDVKPRFPIQSINFVNWLASLNAFRIAFATMDTPLTLFLHPSLYDSLVSQLCLLWTLG